MTLEGGQQVRNQIYRRFCRLVVPAFGVLLFAASAFAQAVPAKPTRLKPSRIVSLNLCTDQILFDLLPRHRIRALSFLAADASVSAIAGEIGDLRLTRGSAEDVLTLDPDLILAGSFTTPATVALLKRLGRRVVVVPLANDFAGIRKLVAQIAAAVGERARGQLLIQRFDRALAAVRKELRARLPASGGQSVAPSAVIYHVSSLASGTGGLADEVLRAAGFENFAARARLLRGGYLPLETLLVHPPDVVVLGHEGNAYRTVMADNLRHPAFRKLASARSVLVVPQSLLLCGTLRTIAAVKALAARRLQLLRKASRNTPMQRSLQ